MAVFFTSDTHFGDHRVLNVDARPFPSVAVHDAALVERWNEIVGRDDEVWHLGDFALWPGSERIAELLAALNGRKHLIIGNNDGPATTEAAGWSGVCHYHELTLAGRLVILCHYPLRTWNRMGRGAIDLHGHSHGRLKPLTRQCDVGVDVWDYRPVDLDTILTARRIRDRRSADAGVGLPPTAVQSSR